MDDHPNENSSESSPGWVRLQIEPVDIPLEDEESLLLSSVQSAIPGAHGIYYKEDEQKKALRYDASTGRVYKGSPGWNSKPLYVVLAHGCRTHYGGLGGQYESATKTFEKSVTAIQRMLAHSGLQRCFAPEGQTQAQGEQISEKTKHESKTSRTHRVREVRQVTCLEAHAEPLLQEESDGSIDSGGSEDLQKLQEENKNLKQKLHNIEENSGKLEREVKEKNEEIGTAKLRIDNLMKEIDRIKNTGYFESSMVESEQAVSAPVLEDSQGGRVDLPSTKRLQEEIQQLEEEIRRKSANFEEFSKEMQLQVHQLQERNEHLQKDIEILKMEKGDLQNALNNVRAELEGKKEETIKLVMGEAPDYEHQLSLRDEKISSLETHVNELRRELDEKNNYIGTLNQEKNEKEWSLGEHRQWLEDANNRIKTLEEELGKKTADSETALRESREQLEHLTSRLAELEEKSNRLEVELHETKESSQKITVELQQKQQDAWTAGDENSKLEQQLREKDDELQRIKPHEEELEKFLSTLQEELDQLRNNLQQKDSEIADITKARNDFEWNLGEHRQWLADANNKINDLSRTLDEKSAELDRLVKEYDEVRNINSQLQERPTPEEYEQMKVRIDEVLSSLKDAEKRIEDEKDRNKTDELNKLVDDLHQELADKGKELEDLRKQKNDAEWSLGEHKQWLEQANNRINDLVKNVEEKAKTFDEVNEELNELRKKQEEYDRQRSEVEQLHDKIKQLEDELRNGGHIELTMLHPEELSSLRERASNLQREVDEKNECINNLTKQKDDAEWKLGEHRAWLDQANTRIKWFEDECRKKDEDRENVTKQLQLDASELQTRVDMLEGELREKSHMVEELIQQKKEMEERPEALQFEILQAAPQQIPTEHEELQKYVLRMEASTKILREKLETEEREIPELEQKLRDFDSVMEGLARDVRSKSEENENLRKEKDEIVKQLEEQKKLLEEAQERINELENTIKIKGEETKQMLDDSRQALEKLEQRNRELELIVPQKEEVELLTREPRDVSKEEAETTLHKLQQELANKDITITDLNNNVEVLRNKLDEKNSAMERIIKERNDFEWQLGEHKQWLFDSKARAQWLESEIFGKNNIINNLNLTVEEKNSIIDKLSETKDEYETLKKEFEVFLEATKESPDQNKLQERISQLETELGEKNRIIDAVNKERDDARWSLGEHQHWLSDANNRINDLERLLKEKDDQIGNQQVEKQNILEELASERSKAEQGFADRIKDLEELLRQAEEKLASAPTMEVVNNLNNAIDVQRSEIDEKNRIIDAVNKERDDARWNLGEHQQWLSDAKNKIDDLERLLKENSDTIEKMKREQEEQQVLKLQVQEEVPLQKAPATQELEEKIAELEHVVREKDEILAAAPTEDTFKNLNEAIDNLRSEINEKNRIIDEVNKERDDARWNLGEHKQWLSDANSRISYLEGLLSEKDGLLGAKDKETDELKKQMSELPSAEEVTKKVEELENSLRQAHDALASAPSAETLEQLQQALDNLQNVINEKNGIIDAVNKERDDAKWHLDENKQWLSEANDRISYLEKVITDKETAIATLGRNVEEMEAVRLVPQEFVEPGKEGIDLEARNRELEEMLRRAQQGLAEAPKPETVDGLNEIVEALGNEINEKKKVIDTLSKEKDDAVWHLGEHKQWLADAKDTVGELESLLKDRDVTIERMKGEVAKQIITLQAPVQLDEEKVSVNQELENRIVELEKLLHEKDEKLSAALCPEVVSNLNEAIDRLNAEVNEKNRIIDAVNKERDDSRWRVGEQEQWLTDCRNRISWLESEMHEKNNIIDSLNGTMYEKNCIIDDLNRQRDERDWTINTLKAQLEELSKLQDRIRELERELGEAKTTLEAVPQQQDINDLNNNIEMLHQVLNEKNAIIDAVNHERDDAKWSLGEHKQWLSDSNNRVQWLESEVNGKNHIIDDLNRIVGEKNAIIDDLNRQRDQNWQNIDELNRLRERVSQLERELNDCRAALDERPRREELDALNASLDNVVRELCEKNAIIDAVNLQRDEANWYLGEHKHWLADAVGSIGELLGVLQLKDSSVEEQKEKIEELSRARPQAEEDIEQLHGKLDEAYRMLSERPDQAELEHLSQVVDGLRNELNEKNAIIDAVNRERDDAKWSLGEHAQWLNDATNRCDALEAAIKERDGIIDTLRFEIEGLSSERRQLEERITEPVTLVEMQKLGQAPDAEDARRAELETLHGTIEGLREESRRKSEEKDQLDNEMKGKIREMSSDASEKQRKIDVLSYQIKELHRVMQEQQDLAKASPIGEISSLNNVINELRGEIDSLQATINGLRDEINEKNRIIDAVNKERDDARWNLGEHKQWLDDANNKVSQLEQLLKEKDNAIEQTKVEIEELKVYKVHITEEQQLTVSPGREDLERKINELEEDLRHVRQALAEAPTSETVKGLNETVDSLRSEVNEKNRIIDEINKERDDAKWHLDEANQRLTDASNRLNTMEALLQEKDKALDELSAKVGDLERAAPETDYVIHLKETITRLESQINIKQTEIIKLRTTKEETKKQLDEHVTWLSDSSKRVQDLLNKVDELENSLRQAEEAAAKAPSVDAIDNLNSTIDSLKKEIEAKITMIETISKDKNDAEWSLGEHKQWLSDANNKIGDLERLLKDKDEDIAQMRQTMEEQPIKLQMQEQLTAQKVHEQEELANRIGELEALLRQAEDKLSSAPTHDQIKNLNDAVDKQRSEIDEKNRIIDAVNKERDDARWKLGEHQQWLSDANNRINDLERILKEKDDSLEKVKAELEEVSGLKHKLEDLERGIQAMPSQDTVDALNTDIENLREEMKNKNAELEDLTRQKNELDWHLGEHKQWLADANRRIAYLEASEADKEDVVGKLRLEHEDEKVKLVQKITELESIIDDLQRGIQAMPSQEVVGALNADVEALRQEINAKNAEIEDLKKQKNDLEWNLGEHKQWLNDSNNKAETLVNTLREKTEQLDQVKAQIEAEMDKRVADLVNEINDKNAIIDAVNKERDDVKWHLGEQQQSLSDANNKISDLERLLREKEDEALAQKQHAEEDLSKRIGELEGLLRQAEEKLAAAPTTDVVDNLNNAIDAQRSEIDEKNRIIDAVNKERDDAKWDLGEHKQWLSDANNRISHLEGLIAEREEHLKAKEKEIEDLKAQISKLPTAEDVAALERLLQQAQDALANAPTAESVQNLQQTVDNLQKVINEKNEIIDAVNKERDDARWSLGEHKRWLADANDKASYLETVLNDKDQALANLGKNVDELQAVRLESQQLAAQKGGELEELKKQIDELNQALEQAKEALAVAPTIESVHELNRTIDSLRNEINTKNSIIDDLNRIKNDLEWSLGEHKQWLSDANNKISQLEDQLKDKETKLDALEKDLEDLRTVRLEVPEPEPAEDVQELIRKISELEEALSSSPNVDSLNNLYNTIDSLKTEISQKNSTIDAVNKERDEARWKLGEHVQWLADANNRANDLQKELDDLQRQIHEKNSTIDKINQEKDALRATIDENRRVFDDFNDKLKKVSDMVREKEEDIEKLHRRKPELPEARERPADVVDAGEQLFAETPKIGEAEDLKETIFYGLTEEVRVRKTRELDEDVQERLQALEHSVCDLRKEVDEKCSQIEQLQRAKNDAEWYLNEHKQWLEDANKRIEILTSQLADKEGELRNAHEVIDQLRRRIEELGKKLHSAEESLSKSTAQDAASELYRTIELLKQTMDSKEQDYSRLLLENENYLKKLEETRLYYNDSKNRIGQLEDEVSRLKDESESGKAEKRTEFYRLQEKYISLEETLKKSEITVINLQREKDILRRELVLEKPREYKDKAEIEAELKRLREKYVILSELLKATEELLMKLRAETPDEAEVNAMRRTIEVLRNQTEEQSLEVENANRRRNDTEWSLAEHRQWLRDANTRVIELENLLAKTKREDDALHRALRSENIEIQEENIHLSEQLRKQQEKITELHERLEDEQQKRSEVERTRTPVQTPTKKEQIVRIGTPPVEIEVTLTDAESVGEDLNVLSRTIDDLRKDLRFHSVIDALDDQKKELERELSEAHKHLQEAYERINELQQLLERKAEEGGLTESVQIIRENMELRRRLEERETTVERSVRTEQEPSTSHDGDGSSFV